MPPIIGGDAVEFGCGYGTFTIPAAQRTSGSLYAFDIEPEMVALTRIKANQSQLNNVHTAVRDFVADGTGLPGGSAQYAMLFNLLHAEQPEILLSEAYRVLSPGGTLGIMHWNYDAGTPRGPSMEIRPRPENCRDWALRAGFRLVEPGIIDLPPCHYGMVMIKPPILGRQGGTSSTETGKR
jgi:SAM-dependent methyltransferase